MKSAKETFLTQLSLIELRQPVSVTKSCRLSQPPSAIDQIQEASLEKKRKNILR